MADRMNMQQAGWYADPWNQAEQRWWDGRQWTPHVSAPVAGAPTPPVLAPPGSPAPGPTPAPPTAPWTTEPDGHVWTSGATDGGGRAGPVWYPGFGPQPRPEPPSNPLIKVLTLEGAAIVVLGSMLTWARVSSEIVDFSASGLDGDGVLTRPGAFGFGVLAASSLRSWSRGRMIAALVVAVLVDIVAAINVADISSRVSDVETVGFDASIGVRLWLVLAGALAGIAGCIMAPAVPKAPRTAG
jgi:Protein of unknown function (DUF2510)